MFTNNVKFYQRAIVFHPTDERFLILKRTEDDSSAPGQWDFPGGGVEFGELHLPALEREVWEESGLAIRAPRVVEVITKYDANRQIYSIFVAHQCRAISTDVCLSAEHTAHHWVTATEWLQMDAPMVLKQVVERLASTAKDGILQ